jgi:hypothetical protein
MGMRWSRMSWSDRNELWARWRRGESVRQIAHGRGARRALSTPSSQAKAALRPVRVDGPS